MLSRSTTNGLRVVRSYEDNRTEISMKTNNPHIYRTKFGRVGFFYSDADGVDRVETYKEMKAIAKNYPEGKRAIRYIARLCNRYIGYWEAWDCGIIVTKGNPRKAIKAYIDKTIADMRKNGIQIYNYVS